MPFWAEPERKNLRIALPAPVQSINLWDGLTTVHFVRGDTTNNLLIRYARLLAATPHLLRIWRSLLERIKQNDSILAAISESHKHLFDEDLDWLADDRYTDVPPWRKTKSLKTPS